MKCELHEGKLFCFSCLPIPTPPRTHTNSAWHTIGVPHVFIERMNRLNYLHHVDLKTKVERGESHGERDRIWS